MDDLKYIAQNCKTDERLLNIVKDIAKMGEKEKKEFYNKIRQYFLGKNSEVDNNAYRFFKIVLDGDNAKKILEILGGE